MTPLRELGPDQLKALTHPIRVHMLRELRTNGPATATLLAKRLGESSGVTSYHLRQLERAGFVEDVPESGNGRERWWRPAFTGQYVATERWMDDPEQAAILSVYQSAVLDVHTRATTEWVSTQSDWPTEWVEASALNDYRLHLTAPRLRELVDAMDALVREYGTVPEAGTPLAEGEEQVVLAFHAFPRTVRPFTEETP